MSVSVAPAPVPAVDRRDDPEFILSRTPYDSATIRVAGSDFGTGSSRDGAVHALVDYGFRAVIAPPLR
ncbi:hypothetical protein [Streptomyces sclerotialus]|uniref:hypothetical protein n=1 Tax=Streptomyces sclerotialus TaxID=1957 RepID=UPI000690DA01